MLVRQCLDSNWENEFYIIIVIIIVMAIFLVTGGSMVLDHRGLGNWDEKKTARTGRENYA